MVWELLYVPVWKSRYMRFIISLETCPTENRRETGIFITWLEDLPILGKLNPQRGKVFHPNREKPVHVNRNMGVCLGELAFPLFMAFFITGLQQRYCKLH
jgi:hypothetical protein